MPVPILGQAIATIPAQARLNAQQTAQDLLAEWWRLELKHGRTETIMSMGTDPTGFLLVVDALTDAGCVVLGVSEIAGQHQNHPALVIHILWRLPANPAKLQ